MMFLSYVLLYFLIGASTINANHYSYLVTIQTENIDEDKNLYMDTLCAGSIISDSWILTAANCILDTDDPDPKLCERLTIVGGIDQSVKVNSQFCQFNNFKEFTVGDDNSLSTENDIALIKLNESFKFTDGIQPIKYITPKMEMSSNLAGKNCLAVGWNLEKLENENKTEYVEEQVEVQLLSSEQCAQGKLDNKIHINDNQICSFHKAYESLDCNINAGGPIICDNVLTAISARATNCAQESLLINCRVDKYYQWIYNTVHLGLTSSSYRSTDNILTTVLVGFIFRYICSIFHT